MKESFTTSKKYKIVVTILCVALAFSCCRNCNRKSNAEFQSYEYTHQLKTLDSTLRVKNEEARMLKDSINILNERLNSANDKINKLDNDNRYYQKINSQLINDNR